MSIAQHQPLCNWCGRGSHSQQHCLMQSATSTTNRGTTVQMTLQECMQCAPTFEKVQAKLHVCKHWMSLPQSRSPHSGMVVVPKTSGQVRICVDYQILNESALREVHPLPAVDETLAQMAGTTMFSKLDANCGFWQIPVHENSQVTFIYFHQHIQPLLLQEIAIWHKQCAQGFQWRISAILAGHKEVQCHTDDISSSVGIRVTTMPDWLQHSALFQMLESHSTDKCLFLQMSIPFMGYIIDQNGVCANPSKTAAV